MSKKSSSAAMKQIYGLLEAGDVLSARLLAARLVQDRPDSADAAEAAEVLNRLRPPRFAYLVAGVGLIALVVLVFIALRFR